MFIFRCFTLCYLPFNSLLISLQQSTVHPGIFVSWDRDTISRFSDNYFTQDIWQLLCDQNATHNILLSSFWGDNYWDTYMKLLRNHVCLTCHQACSGAVVGELRQSICFVTDLQALFLYMLIVTHYSEQLQASFIEKKSKKINQRGLKVCL